VAREGRASVVATAQGQMGRVRRTGRDLAFNMATRKRNAPCGAKDDVRPIEPRALSVPSAARAAGISRSMLYKLAAAGKLKPRISHRFRLDQAAEALHAVIDRAVIGKAVLVS